MDNIMKWDIGILNKLIGLTFKKNMYITVSVLRNLQKLLNQSDFSVYQNKGLILKRVQFLKKALQAKLDEKLEDESLILNFCRDDLDDPVVEDIINNLPKYRQLNHQEIKFLIAYIDDRLHFGVIQAHIEKMADLIEKIEDGEYSTYRQARLMMDQWAADYNLASRATKTKYQDNIIDFNDPNLQDKVEDVLSRLGNTSSIIITGIQMLNEMLSPGFRPGKLYMFLGLTGGFKSAMLLKIVLDCVTYNAKTYKPRKEGYKPYVLYLTMENSKDESFERTYNMAVSNDDPVDHDSGWIVQQLKDKKLAFNDDIGMIIWHEPNRSITTNEIRNIIDELDSQGKEVIMLSFDYIKRIRPQEAARTEKEELKNVTNELRRIAQDYLIPVVSAQQINRSGVASVNIAKRDDKADLAKFLGAENVGDAWEVMENADMTIILNLEKRKSDQQLFITFFRIKERYRPYTRLDYFNQPFVPDNDIMIKDDIYEEKPIGVISLKTDMEGVDAEMLFETRGRKQLKPGSQMAPNFNTEELFNIPALSTT